MLATWTNFFWISLDKGLKNAKRGFLFSGISSDDFIISFYVWLFIFEEIFFWIAWVTFRWILFFYFSFSFKSHKTNYVSKECKKGPKKAIDLITFACLRGREDGKFAEKGVFFVGWWESGKKWFWPLEPFSKLKTTFVNIEHQLKSKLAWTVCIKE